MSKTKRFVLAVLSVAGIVAFGFVVSVSVEWLAGFPAGRAVLGWLLAYLLCLFGIRAYKELGSSHDK